MEIWAEMKGGKIGILLFVPENKIIPPTSSLFGQTNKKGQRKWKWGRKRNAISLSSSFPFSPLASESAAKLKGGRKRDSVPVPPFFFYGPFISIHLAPK